MTAKVISSLMEYEKGISSFRNYYTLLDMKTKADLKFAKMPGKVALSEELPGNQQHRVAVQLW